MPCTEVLWTQSAVALFNAVSVAPAGVDAYFDWHSLGTVEKRNYLVERFLERQDLDWVLMIDSDMIPPPDVVQRLLNGASVPGRDVVAALCFTRHGVPYCPAAGYWTEGEDELRWMEPSEFDGTVRQVDWVGTGCVFIWRRVLERLKEARGQRVFRGIDWRGRATGRGEDQEFSRAVGLLGFGLFCDTSTQVGHLGLTNVDLPFVTAHGKSERGNKPDAHGAVVR